VNAMSDKLALELSKKLNVLISLSLRTLTEDLEFSSKGKKKRGVGEQARYLADMGLEAADIAQILGAPLASVRTLLTPSQRK
jgi:hypothetical protein